MPVDPNTGKVFLDPNSPSFATIDDAANAVSTGLAQGNEQAAVVIKRPDGSFGYSTVSPQDQDGFSIRAMLPQGHSLAGIVHSHPGTDSNAGYFSPNDIQTAAHLAVPSYIRFNKDSAVRKYVPGKTQTSNLDVSGNRFGAIIAVGDSLTLTPPPAATPGDLSQVTRRDNNTTPH